RDSWGSPTFEKVYGSGTISSTQFRTNRSYNMGQLLSVSREGLYNNWKSFDVTRENSSNLIIYSRDPNSLTTSYGYDLLGRLTSISPPGEAATGITYDTSNKVTATRTGSDDSTRGRYLYDGFGRLIREIRQMPSDPSP